MKEKAYTTHIMQDADAGKRLHNLKRRRTGERGNITRFVTEVGKFTDTTTLEDYEYYKDRQHDSLGQLTSLDDDIHELLDDSEYDADIQTIQGHSTLQTLSFLKFGSRFLPLRPINSSPIMA